MKKLALVLGLLFCPYTFSCINTNLIEDISFPYTTSRYKSLLSYQMAYNSVCTKKSIDFSLFDSAKDRISDQEREVRALLKSGEMKKGEANYYLNFYSLLEKNLKTCESFAYKFRDEGGPRFEKLIKLSFRAGGLVDIYFRRPSESSRRKS